MSLRVDDPLPWRLDIVEVTLRRSDVSSPILPGVLPLSVNFRVGTIPPESVPLILSDTVLSARLRLLLVMTAPKMSLKAEPISVMVLLGREFMPPTVCLKPLRVPGPRLPSAPRNTGTEGSTFGALTLRLTVTPTSILGGTLRRAS